MLAGDLVIALLAMELVGLKICDFKKSYIYYFAKYCKYTVKTCNNTSMNIKRIVKAFVAMAAIVGVAFLVQSFSAPQPISSNAPQVPSASSSKKFVKTSNKCSTCSCSGYWGYKHENGKYEGACSNTDNWGHKCGHGPEKHGLKKW